ncbi:MAG: DUF4199 domain-containing protein [Flavobacteriaceae bacterium]|nr:DUF4199 domain-containing protein [Muriicola sp.]NNC63096.1 DUF4199 domain-containing protein [Eudoraea sp.]NNK10020.1 DUF4199 domain-containing protein [Flavobacteriaceae bacterium]MBT8290838.1 DUF4199 domain-containing protein [Muriicola sp.]NNK36037.1 DUF4199 domain-containing protein [Eudoraea sp.]
MEQNQPTIGKFSLTYGLILGAISVVFGLMLYSMDAHTSQDTSNTVISIVIAVAIIMLGIFNFRKANEGYLSLGQAIKLAIMIALVSGLIWIVYMLFMVNVLDTNFITTIAENQKAAMEAEGTLSAAQIEQQYEGTINYFWISYPIILIINVVMGFVIGLIGGLIFKKS